MVLVPLSMRVSDATPPQTMAPSRPLPIGSASVQCLAGPLNVIFRGLELPPSASIELGFHRSFSADRRTRSNPPSSITDEEGKASEFVPSVCYKSTLWDPPYGANYFHFLQQSCVSILNHFNYQKNLVRFLVI